MTLVKDCDRTYNLTGTIREVSGSNECKISKPVGLGLQPTSYFPPQVVGNLQVMNTNFFEINFDVQHRPMLEFKFEESDVTDAGGPVLAMTENSAIGAYILVVDPSNSEFKGSCLLVKTNF